MPQQIPLYAVTTPEEMRALRRALYHAQATAIVRKAYDPQVPFSVIDQGWHAGDCRDEAQVANVLRLRRPAETTFTLVPTPPVPEETP